MDFLGMNMQIAKEVLQKSIESIMDKYDLYEEEEEEENIRRIKSTAITASCDDLSMMK